MSETNKLFCNKCGGVVREETLVTVKVSIGDFEKECNLHRCCFKDLIATVKKLTSAIEDSGNISSEVLNNLDEYGMRKKSRRLSLEDRADIIGMLESGISVNEVSKKVDRPYATIYKIFRNIKREKEIYGIDECFNSRNVVEHKESEKDGNKSNLINPSLIVYSSMNIKIINKNHAIINNKNADLGMYRALKRVRWSYKDIALDMRIDEDEVKELERVYLLWIKNPNIIIKNRTHV